MTVTNFTRHLRKPLLELLAAGGCVARDGNRVLIDGPPTLADGLREHAEELAWHVVPSVSAKEAGLVRSLLADAGASVAYITSPNEARRAVAEIHASNSDVIGLDFETEVLPAFRQPIPVKFNKDGNLAIRQPRDGAAGAALDPYRSKVRLVQVWAGGEHCYVFDMRSVAWSDIAPLFELPLAIFNAVFEVKRLIHEAKIEPSGCIYDVMTAVWLTDGRRPSLAEAVAINYGLNIPKELGASDWSSDTLSPEQLEYAALDAVLCRSPLEYAAERGARRHRQAMPRGGRCGYPGGRAHRAARHANQSCCPSSTDCTLADRISCRPNRATTCIAAARSAEARRVAGALIRRARR